MLRAVESANRQNQQKSGMPPAASSLPGRHASQPKGKLFRLQAMHGNQGVQRLLRGGVLQRKLTINQPGDAFEQEADRVAEKVMRMPDPAATQRPVATSGTRARLQRCSCGKSADTGAQCEECKSQAMQLQRSASASTGNATAPPIVHDVLNSSGRPLDAATRNFMEPRFGADFSNVRVHTGDKASESAKAVGALAYTVGKDIVFGASNYHPQTDAGRKLLGHELAHTIQQAGSFSGLQAHQHVQRTIGDGHDLTSPRFALDRVLEAVYDNERLLRNGDQGPAVKKLQQALLDSGFALPQFGVDGIFGPETEAAVREFQRASGLIGRDRDGIVGPTTMGWLDQRFSAGPTPAGTSPGATTGCRTIRNFDIDIVSLDGSTRAPLADLDFANTVFNQCCVRFNLRSGGSENAARTRALLGGDTDLNNTGINCGIPSAEETGLFSGASADFGLSSPLRIFYVASLSSGNIGYSMPAQCSAGALAGLTGMAAVANSAAPRSLAHELGHILMNTVVHLADTNNLMHITGGATGEQLTPAQCATI